MADYKVHLGVKLNTSDINTQISRYKAEPIDIRAKLNLADIKSQLQSYKAEIEVQTKLNTTGLAKKIGEYQPKTPVNLRAELNTSDIDTKINSYKAKPIEVGVSLRTADIKEQLKNYKTSETIEVDARLNHQGIDKAIQNYTPKSRIKVRLALNSNDIEDVLKGYTPSQPLKVKVRIDRADVNAQLKQYKADHEDAFIKVKAKLDNDAITQAIKDYKAITPIKVALELDYSDIDKKVNAYRAKSPVDFPVNMKLNVKDIGEQLKKYRLTIPVQLLVGDIDLANIEQKLASYKTKTPITIGVKLDNGDINSQIKAYKVNTPLQVTAQLDSASISNQIKGYKTKTPIKLNAALDMSDIDGQIKAYKAVTPIEVGINLNTNNLREQMSSGEVQAPIKVDIQLDREKINEQIKKFTPSSKLKVCVKLDFASHKDGQAGISQQINNYKTKSKIKVGVQLDKDDIAQQIAATKTDTPIKLGVELDPEGINNVKTQINNLKQQIKSIGNVKINLGGSNVGAGTGTNVSAGAAGTANAGVTGTNLAKGIAQADIQITNMADHVHQLEGALEQMGFESSAINSITKELKAMDVVVNRVVTRLDKNNNMMLTIMGTDKANRRNVTLTRGVDVEGKDIEFTKVSQKIGETEKFLQRQASAVTRYTNQINEANSKATDQNNKHAIKQSEHLTKLEGKYKEVIAAIQQMGNASSDAFNSDENNVKTLISQYRILESTLRSAEHPSLDVDSGDYATDLEKAKNKLAAFKREAEGFPQMSQTVKELYVALEKVGDVGSLRTFTNQLDVAESALKNIKAEANDAYKTLLDAQKKIDGLSTQVARLNPEVNVEELAKLSTQLEEAESDYKSLKKTLSGKLSLSQQGNLAENADDLSQKLEAIEAKHRDTRAELAKKIAIKLETGKFTTQVQKVHSDASRLSNVSHELETKLEALDNAQKNMNAAFQSGSVNEQINSYRQYLRILADVENQLKQNKIQEQDAVRKDNFKASIKGLSSDMTSWLKGNSVAAKRFGDDIKRLQSQLQTCDNSVDFNNIKQEFRNVQKEAKALGLTGLTTIDKLKHKFKEYMAYFSIAEVFMYAEQGLRSMFEQVKLIDSAMTELKKVTNETDETYSKFLTNAASRSKEIGTTIDGLVSSTADFARLGYGFEDAQGLAEVANIYAVVGDEIEDIEQATESLISTMAAFKDQADGMSNSDFAMSIVDKFNEIGNNFAISSGGIGEALERSASALDAANNTLDESIALITAANTVVQDPEAVGTAFKTISMRIRGAKTELEDAGLETEGMIESTATLRAEIEALSGVDIMEADGRTFKSTYAILDELAQKWDDLSDIQQATVTELIAGRVFCQNVQKCA